MFEKRKYAVVCSNLLICNHVAACGVEMVVCGVILKKTLASYKKTVSL